MRSYEAARTYFNIFGFIAWAVIIIGGIVALAGLGAGSQANFYGQRSTGVALASALPGVGVMIFGFLLLVGVQVGRATVDSAEYAQQSLAIAREQLEISQRAERQRNGSAQGFADVKPAATSSGLRTPPASFSSDSAPQATASTQPTISADDSVIEYRGKNIRAVEGGFKFGGTVFPDLDAAKAYVDRDGSVLPQSEKQPPPYASQLGVTGEQKPDSTPHGNGKA